MNIQNKKNYIYICFFNILYKFNTLNFIFHPKKIFFFFDDFVIIILHIKYIIMCQVISFIIQIFFDYIINKIK